MTPAAVPLDPSREQARGWALEELSGREYAGARPGAVERLATWLLARLQGVDVPSDPVSSLTLGVALLAVLAAVGYALHRTGGLRRSGRRSGRAVLDRPGTTAAEHRAAADRHAAAREWARAILERFRGIARGLEEQAVLLPRPGRTADEVARDAGEVLPVLAEDLAAAARLFDDVAYGDRPGDPAAEERLRRLDERLRRARVPAG